MHPGCFSASRNSEGLLGFAFFKKPFETKTDPFWLVKPQFCEHGPKWMSRTERFSPAIFSTLMEGKPFFPGKAHFARPVWLSPCAPRPTLLPICLCQRYGHLWLLHDRSSLTTKHTQTGDGGNPVAEKHLGILQEMLAPLSPNVCILAH